MYIAPLHLNATMSETTIQLREQNPEETDKMAQYESPNEEAVCASYIARAVADRLGEFAALTIDDDAEVEAELQKTTQRYAVYETPGGGVTGLYVNLDNFEDEAPETAGLQFSPSDEDSWEDAMEDVEEEAEEEAEALVAGESDDSDDEEEVEISDEEVGLVEAE